MILATGAIVRLYRIESTWFLLDHVRDVSIASGISAGNSFPLLGPMIGWTEAYLGPLYFYLLAIPLSVSRDPVAVSLFVAVSQLLGLLLLFRFAKEFLGVVAALYATALFAVFPLTIFSSAMVWHAGLQPPIVVLYMHAMFRLLVYGKSASMVSLFVLMAVLTQLHLSSIALAVVALIGMWLFRPRVRFRHVGIGAVLFVILYFPYLCYEMANDFPNVRAVFLAGTSSQGMINAGGLVSVMRNVLLLFSRALSGFMVGIEWPRAFRITFWTLYGIESLCVAIGLVICIYRVCAQWRDVGADAVAERCRLTPLLLWIAVPILAFGTKNTAIPWYYLDIIQPALFILAGITLSLQSMPKAFPVKWLRPAAVCLMAAIVLSQVYFRHEFQRRVARNGEIVVALPRLSLNENTSGYETLISLPMEYRRKILRALGDDFGVGEQGFSTRIHGAVLGLPESNRYLVRHLSGRSAVRQGTPVDPIAHYLVTKAAGRGPRPTAIRAKRIGPYAIVEYRPLIDHGSWKCLIASPGRARNWDGPAPASPVGLLTRGDEHVFCRGRVYVPATQSDIHVAVNVVAWSPFRAVALETGKRQFSPVDREMRQDPLMLKVPTGWRMGIGWAEEAVFDITGTIEPGEAWITVELAGIHDVADTRGIVGFDVYEGRSW